MRETPPPLLPWCPTAAVPSLLPPPRAAAARRWQPEMTRSGAGPLTHRGRGGGGGGTGRVSMVSRERAAAGPAGIGSVLSSSRPCVRVLAGEAEEGEEVRGHEAHDQPPG